MVLVYVHESYIALSILLIWYVERSTAPIFGHGAWSYGQGEGHRDRMERRRFGQLDTHSAAGLLILIIYASNI